MIAGSSCDCLICRLEKSLTADLDHEYAATEYKRAILLSNVLSGFPTPLSLVRELHTPTKTDSSADVFIAELLKHHRGSGAHPIWQKLFLLVFIPTIHRTTSQVPRAKSLRAFLRLLGTMFPNTTSQRYSSSFGLPSCMLASLTSLSLWPERCGEKPSAGQFTKHATRWQRRPTRP
jgi:hypothetical protein